MLRPFLLALAQGRPPEAQLITRDKTPRGGRRDRYWLHYHLQKLCKEARVPVVCPHSLRGLHATLATEAGATSHVVAAALGHTSPAVTQAHYIQPGTFQRARTRRVAGKIGAALALVPPANDNPLDDATSVRAAGNR